VPYKYSYLLTYLSEEFHVDNIYGSSINNTYRPAMCYQHGAAGSWKVVTLIAGSKRRSLLMAGDDDEMFMTRILNVNYAKDNRTAFNCTQ